MFIDITLYATAVALLVLGVLWAETRLNDEFSVDNALTWAQDAYEEWWWARKVRVIAIRRVERFDAVE